jgi:hypothetical protein
VCEVSVGNTCRARHICAAHVAAPICAVIPPCPVEWGKEPDRTPVEAGASFVTATLAPRAHCSRAAVTPEGRPSTPVTATSRRYLALEALLAPSPALSLRNMAARPAGGTGGEGGGGQWRVAVRRRGVLAAASTASLGDPYVLQAGTVSLGMNMAKQDSPLLLT